MKPDARCVLRFSMVPEMLRLHCLTTGTWPKSRGTSNSRVQWAFLGAVNTHPLLGETLWRGAEEAKATVPQKWGAGEDSCT